MGGLEASRQQSVAWKARVLEGIESREQGISKHAPSCFTPRSHASDQVPTRPSVPFAGSLALALLRPQKVLLAERRGRLLLSNLQTSWIWRLCVLRPELQVVLAA